jgi:hypothetical protein
VVAKAVEQKPDGAWSQYLVWMRGSWEGDVAQVLEEQGRWQTKLSQPPREASETDPRSFVAKTITYLENNWQRMHYPVYRRQGLPVTTAWMESLVKELNYRVKGTEVFWNDREGAEAILQVRAAALCDDERLDKHLRTRPGYQFVRRPKSPRAPSEKKLTCTRGESCRALGEGRLTGAEPFAGDRVIIECDGAVGQDLEGSAAFTDDQHDVAGASVGQCSLDGDTAVRFDADFAGTPAGLLTDSP